MIQVESRVAPSIVVPDPAIVFLVHVRRIGVALVIPKVTLFRLRRCRGRTTYRLRTTGRCILPLLPSVPAIRRLAATLVPVLTLRRRERKK